ncbi:MAG TPA: DUF433 domain-containing protein [Longimicrobium sp.]|jgi:uncharacterized protein (DUF433 family)
MDKDARPLTLPDGSVVHSDPDVHSGDPVFVGTRVPVQSLVEYLEGGYTLEEFLDHFPSVRREQAVALLKLSTSTFHIAEHSMEPQDNLKVNLQKAINTHEDAMAAVADVLAHSPDPVYSEMLTTLKRNVEMLRAQAAKTPPDA